MLDWSTCQAVERDPGATVEQFLEWFAGVTRTHVDAVLEHAARSVQAVSSTY